MVINGQMVINGPRSLFHDMVNSFNCQLLHGFWRLVNLSLEYNPVTSCPFKKKENSVSQVICLANDT